MRCGMCGFSLRTAACGARHVARHAASAAATDAVTAATAATATATIDTSLKRLYAVDYVLPQEKITPTSPTPMKTAAIRTAVGAPGSGLLEC